MQSEFKFILEKHNESTANLWGGKARNLFKMNSLDLNIPNGFVIEENSYDNSELKKAIQLIGGYPVAVRSSGDFEDMANASFAGLYETILNVANEEQLDIAIKKCFESSKSERVADYFKNKNLDIQSNQMRVFVQKMITPKFSGVIFSIDPIEGKEEIQIIETVQGLGERLVSGTITPSHYQINYQTKKIIKSIIGVDKVELSSDLLNEISNIALKIQAFFKCPQDIEWCIDHENKIWILQARPITQIKYRTDVEELTNADFKDGGISARVCTPLMYSLYEKCLNESMGTYFAKIGLTKENLTEGWIYFYYGRAYWSATRVKNCLSSIPGWNEEEFDQDLGIVKEYGPKGAIKVPTNIKTILKAIPVLFLLNKEYKDNTEMINSFISEFEVLDHKWKNELTNIKNLNNKDFFELFNKMVIDYYLRVEKNYFRTIYNNSNYQSDFKSYIKSLEKKHNIQINSLALLSNLEEVSHLKIQKDLDQLHKIYRSEGVESELFQSHLSKFLSIHYHHGDAELDLLTPRWGESIDRVLELVKSHTTSQHLEANVYQQEIARLKNTIHDKKFFKMLNKSRWYLTQREKLREFSTRSYYIVRLFTLELGKRYFEDQTLSDQMDIFFLNIQEIIALNKNKALTDGLKENIKFRKLMYYGLMDFKAPNEFGGKLIQNTSINLNSNQLKGVACSNGKIKGKAFVAKTLAETKNFINGDILITKFTDPGWTPILAKVSGVITEVGGVLSHAAVISREYGIPAILNVTAATDIIKTGDYIEIDGDTGLITILKD